MAPNYEISTSSTCFKSSVVSTTAFPSGMNARPTLISRFSLTTPVAKNLTSMLRQVKNYTHLFRATIFLHNILWCHVKFSFKSSNIIWLFRYVCTFLCLSFYLKSFVVRNGSCFFTTSFPIFSRPNILQTFKIW